MSKPITPAYIRDWLLQQAGQADEARRWHLFGAAAGADDAAELADCHLQQAEHFRRMADALAPAAQEAVHG